MGERWNGRRAFLVGGRAPVRLVRELRVAAIIYSYSLQDTQMRQRQRLGRALLIEAVSAVATMVLPVSESERGSAAHADIGVGPFRGL